MAATPSSRATRIAKWSTIPVALVISGVLVSQASHSAFSATTDNPSNNWSTGTVSLRDDDNGSAMFAVTNMKPGDTGSKCITVTSDGTLPSDVKLYTANASQTGGLDAHLNLTITKSASCGAQGETIYSGTAQGLTGSASSFATGIGTWGTAGTPGESNAYTITYTLAAETPNTAQGGTASLDFVWEAQNK
ncbi:hypothetical protein EK0264_18955 [Epidermidibacterium keratini]|uniref:Camelysin metallo-endopeptidase n=1 Tax=Epidermidibacterium keratini TaxID=1891644 RepID=A0A7L4YT96_9ACTN|nr:TasA family protein [Epidermidibacterium keratini]QHC02144.1 hypothetical protein EK0264_18955 [Epidermidibacterium keratini]